MTRTFARQFMPLVSLALLGGCQMFAPANNGHLASGVTTPDMSGYFAQLLDQGRTHLQHQRPAAALIAYRQASHDPASRAAAFNGMAIAYDRIGRADLAQRYFLAAIAVEPGNPSFLANLDRLIGSRTAMAPAEAGRVASADLPQEVIAQTSIPASTADGLQRVSEHEVRVIATGPGQGELSQTSTSAGALVWVEGRPTAAGVLRSADPSRVPLAANAPSAEAATPGQMSNRAARTGRPRRSVSIMMPGPRAPAYPVRVMLDQS